MSCDESCSSSSAERPASSLRSAAQPSSEKSKGITCGSAARPATLLEQVEQLGHYPRRKNGPAKPKNRKQRAENSLAKKISKQWSQLDNATKAELTRIKEETKGKDVEEQAERRAAANDRRRDAAKARTTRLRTLLEKLRSSKSRCDCNDFAHWYGLWRCNPQLTICLRAAGHHFEHCRLAHSAVRPAHAMAGEWYSERRSTYQTSLGSSLDPDMGEEVGWEQDHLFYGQ